MDIEQQLEQVQGSIERIVFHSEDSGFCVVRTKVKGHRDLVTVIGNAATLGAGEFIECEGTWINDKKHGLQFKAQHLKVIPPATLEGIEKYLGSGMLKGIGPHFAKKLVSAFGDQVFDVIENHPNRLTQVAGIGRTRRKQVVTAWAEQKSIRKIMIFLQSHGLSTARAVRIYKTYGDDAIDKVKENPYRLALDIRGIGFKTADTLAGELGIPKDSLVRAQAGVRHVLQELCDRGHCAARREQLIDSSHELLEIVHETIEQAIDDEVAQENIVPDTIKGEACLYPVALYKAEFNAADHIRRLNGASPPWGKIKAEKAIPWVEKKVELELADSQVQAIETVLDAKLAIITGGPGVGKTTIVNAFLKIIQTKGLRVGLCAPTGRAAKRITETTGMEAKTIHRLLEFDPISFGFQHDEYNPLPFDVLIIDESSMIDIVLFNNFLKAIPEKSAVIFVGDIDQLPSVGSGAVLQDLIQSGVITTVRLTEIFRQAEDSKIIINAHRINKGEMPLANEAKNNDFFTLAADTPEEAHALLIDVVSHRLPTHYRCDPVRDIQVLSPMNRGGLGCHSLNLELQKTLNSQSQPGITRFGCTYYPGDKVIQMSNNYDKEVFNGDIGFIEFIDAEEGVIQIRFDDSLIAYDTSELDEVSLAYAITIHKSQGSEFPIVVIPMVMQHYRLLARNLLYTGVTRGRQLVVLVGQRKAIAMAVGNNNEAHRLTNLSERLSQCI